MESECKDCKYSLVFTSPLLDLWIQCSTCDQWYHQVCAGLNVSEDEASEIDEFHCKDCALDPKNGPSVYFQKHRKSFRDRNKVDYASLERDGDFLTTGKYHPYNQIVQTRVFGEDRFQRLHGHELRLEWAQRTGFQEPAIVPKDWRNGLDMQIPEDLTVLKVVEIIGGSNQLDVMDVPSQREVNGWSLQEWADYYETPAELRDRVRNVISLECSETPLAKMIRRPKFVREMDLVDFVWPVSRSFSQDMTSKIAGFPRPKVSLYCLMSAASSFTDFHIDFGGSSVFYHVLRGTKCFLFIPPTAINLKRYEVWCNSDTQNSTFFADEVKECIKLILNQGDTMVIPSGWIHAVYTPVDALVIGGNFLTPLHICSQINIAMIEHKTQVPKKFRYPSFNQCLWYTALYYYSQPKDRFYSKYEEEGLQRLAVYLYELYFTGEGQNMGLPIPKKTARVERPPNMKNGIAFLKHFAKFAFQNSEHIMPSWCSSEEEDLTLSHLTDTHEGSLPRKRKLSSERSETPLTNLSHMTFGSTLNETASSGSSTQK